MARFNPTTLSMMEAEMSRFEQEISGNVARFQMPRPPGPNMALHFLPRAVRPQMVPQQGMHPMTVFQRAPIPPQQQVNMMAGMPFLPRMPPVMPGHQPMVLPMGRLPMVSMPGVVTTLVSIPSTIIQASATVYTPTQAVGISDSTPSVIPVTTAHVVPDPVPQTIGTIPVTEMAVPTLPAPTIPVGMASGLVVPRFDSLPLAAGSSLGDASTGVGTIPADSGPSTSAEDGSTQLKAPKKPKRYIRCAAGEMWEDPSLCEWDPSDYRVFCGDLGNEVSDELLAKAFRKYPTFQKAKVVRDRRTNKTKGYGFVSFKDPHDFMRAIREMNGKYVGNRPIKLRKSDWQDRNLDSVKKKVKEKFKLGLRV